MNEGKKHITICMGSSCFTRGNKDNLKIIQNYLKEKDLEAEIRLTGSLCREQCRKGPVIYLNEAIHTHVEAADLPDLLSTFAKE